jgi:hypothetical protein
MNDEAIRAHALDMLRVSIRMAREAGATSDEIARAIVDAGHAGDAFAVFGALPDEIALAMPPDR